MSLQPGIDSVLYTQFLTSLALLGYYMELLGEGAFRPPATIVGFRYVHTAILAANIASETRFVIGILSLVQIIYLTEVGSLIMTSKMPIGFGPIAIFYKTIISSNHRTTNQSIWHNRIIYYKEE